jgi:hypothetical protein
MERRYISKEDVLCRRPKSVSLDQHSSIVLLIVILDAFLEAAILPGSKII